MTNDRMTRDAACEAGEAGLSKDEGMPKHEGASASSFVIRHSSLRRRGRVLERVTFWLFRLATYFVLIAAALIFLDIGIKGGAYGFHEQPAVHQPAISH